MASNNHKRREQLKEKARRQLQRQRDRITTGRYLLGHADATPEALARECAAAIALHPSLRQIIDYPYKPDETNDDDAILAQYGLADYHQHLFTFDDADDGYSKMDGNFGGHSMFFRDAHGADFSVVLLRQHPSLDNKAQASMNMAILFHELGHVDDFERGLNLIPDRSPVDIGAAEFYANLYACRQLRDRGYMVSLCAFMAGIEGSVAQCRVPSLEAAARKLIDLEEYQAMRKPLRRLIRGFEETFGPPAYVAKRR